MTILTMLLFICLSTGLLMAGIQLFRFQKVLNEQQLKVKTLTSEFNAISNKICRPVVNKVKQAEPDHYTSDCMMAGHHIENNLDDGSKAKHPMTLLRKAYNI